MRRQGGLAGLGSQLLQPNTKMDSSSFVIVGTTAFACPRIVAAAVSSVVPRTPAFLDCLDGSHDPTKTSSRDSSLVNRCIVRWNNTSNGHNTILRRLPGVSLNQGVGLTHDMLP